MISYLQGIIQYKERDQVTLLTSGGVGYAVQLTAVHAADLGEGSTVSVHIYTRVTENAIDLFGFSSVGDRTFFELLLTVKGVGPKSAMSMLALGSIEQIQDAIARGDVTYLSSVQGMGKKTAERLCVELKGKIRAQSIESEIPNSGAVAEVVDALVAMGYAKNEAKERVQTLGSAGKTTEQLLKEALTQ